MEHDKRSRSAESDSRSMHGVYRGLIVMVGMTLVMVFATVAVFASINFVLKWGGSGTANGQFITPTGVATDSAGKVYVADVISSQRFRRE